MYVSLALTSSEEFDFKQHGKSNLLHKSAIEARSLKPGYNHPHQHADIDVPVSEDVDVLRPKVMEVVHALVPPWKNLKEDQFEIKKCAGGLTNQLYRVSTKAKQSTERVLLRIYGDKTEELVDRNGEIVIWQRLHACKLGPRFYGTYNNGCVYGYVEGRPLNIFDIMVPEVGGLVAVMVGKMHALVDILQFDKKPMLWDCIDKWLALVPKDYEHVKNKALVETFLEMNMDLEKEVAALRDTLEQLQSPVVFCHNDVNPGNIIYHEEAKSVMLIDHEYACYNYRGFDLANHFCEYTGIGLEWDRFPHRDHQMPFLRKYLEAYRAFEHQRLAVTSDFETPGISDETEIQIPRSVDNGEGEGVGVVVVTEEEVERLYVEVNRYTLASHLFWAVWGLLQAKNSLIDFDYFEYSLKRLRIYQKTKEGGAEGLAI